MQGYKDIFRQVADFAAGAASAATYLATGGQSVGYTPNRPTSKALANGGMAGIVGTLALGTTTVIALAHQTMTLMR